MIEQDYIIRLITVLSRFLARILFHKNSRDFPKALLEIQTTGKLLVGIELSLVEKLSASQLMTLFGADTEISMPKSYILGILLKEEADVRRLMGEQESADRLNAKALTLLVETFLAGGEGVEHRHGEAIGETLSALRGCTLPADLLRSLFDYEEFIGRYDKAEDLLYEILDTDETFARRGIIFYERLLAQTDEQLEKGNLPRAEVNEGLEKLRSRFPPPASSAPHQQTD
jgi:hypothetical protein